MKTLLSNELFSKSYRLRIPLYTIFELTYKCNLSCKHCYIPQHLRMVKELSIHKLKQTIYEIAQLGGLYIVFTGGEPLLRKEIFSLIKFAKKLNFVVILFSNGSLITQDVAKKLAKVSIDVVEISIYGSKKVHNQFVSSDVFKNVINAVKFLKKYKITVYLKTVVTKFNIDDFEYIKRLADNLDVKLKIDYVVTLKNDGDTEPLRLQVDNHQLLDLLKNSEISRVNNESKTLKSLICSAGYNVVGITPDGVVYPCIQFPYKLGDLRKESFTKIWRKDVFITRIENKNNYQCFRCDLLNFCNRCPGLCYIESGSIYGCSSIVKNMAQLNQKIFAGAGC